MQATWFLCLGKQPLSLSLDLTEAGLDLTGSSRSAAVMLTGQEEPKPRAGSFTGTRPHLAHLHTLLPARVRQRAREC